MYKIKNLYDNILPYTDGSAVGLAFANDVSIGNRKMSPSLRIIFKEIEDTIYGGCMLNQDPTLESWVNQGVLLLNTALTVKKGQPGSHKDLWELLTYKILSVLNQNRTGIIYLLWGKHAQYYAPCINPNNNYILEAPHPAAEIYSPGIGFLGCKHFVKVNELIQQSNGDGYAITW